MCYFRFDYHICATQTAPELECTARMVSLRIFKWNFKSHSCWIQYLNVYTHSTTIAVYIKVFTTFCDGKFKYLRNSNDLKVYAYVLYIYIYIWIWWVSTMTHVTRYRLHAVDKSMGEMKSYKKYFSDRIFYLFFVSFYFFRYSGV